MRANRAFELIISREGIGPAFLADPQRTDRIELLSIDDGEVVLYWELPARRASKLLRALRGDLATLDADAFLARWQTEDPA